MEFVNKAIGPLIELGKSMTPAARVTAALLLLATVVSLAWLFNQQVVGADVYLMGGELFSPSELRDMQAAFGKAGLEAQLDGGRIKIPRGQESKYMAALADADAMPAEFGQYMQKAVTSSGFLRIPHSQQEAAWRVAKQQELQLIVGGMHGIERAAVQIDQETVDEFPRGKKTVTAAVTVHPAAAQPLDDRTVRTIRQLVASSVAGLKPDAVTVVDMSTNRHFGPAAGGGSGGGGDYADQQERHELEWQAKIARVLEHIPGVVVNANVELDVDGAGRETQVGAQPKRVTAAVSVPNTYYERIWRQEHPAAAGAAQPTPDPATLAAIEAREKQRITQLIVNLLPGRDVDGRSVAVSTFYPLAESVPVEPELRDRALAWLGEHWNAVSLAGLAVVGLLVLRSMVRSIHRGAAPADHTSLEMPATLSLVTDEFETAGSTPREPEPRRGGRADSLTGELADVVRQDPDAAVSVLRSWIGNAS